MQAILALNSGSSSLKFRMRAEGLGDLIHGHAARLGTEHAHWQWQSLENFAEETLPHASHGEVLAQLSERIAKNFDCEIAAIGHRIVHGGAKFSAPMIITPNLLSEIRDLTPLAPLHQPAGILGVEKATLAFPDAIQIAIFDTGFHSEKPWVQNAYAIDESFYENGIRRYGFHGISCQSVLRQLKDVPPRLIIAHLGNGSSITAVKAGKSHANSMGFSTLDGVSMGSRPGHFDPGIILHWLKEGQSHDEIEKRLYHQAGLLGLSGLSNDIRDLQASQTPRAQSALEFFIARIIEEIARMAATMGGVDRVVFCGGIGENAHELREKIEAGIGFLFPNQSPISQIIRTDEEGEIIAQCKAMLS